jgi:transposase
MPAKIILDEKAIITEYINGESGVVIAKRLGVSNFVIYELLKKQGIVKHGARAQPRNWLR